MVDGPSGHRAHPNAAAVAAAAAAVVAAAAASAAGAVLAVVVVVVVLVVVVVATSAGRVRDQRNHGRTIAHDPPAITDPAESVARGRATGSV